MNGHIQRYTKYWNILLCTLLLIGMWAVAAFGADPNTQHITMTPSATALACNETVTVEVVYDSDTKVTSFTTWIHYDSSQLEYSGYSDFIGSPYVGNPTVGDDTDDFDNNPNTDKRIVLAFVSLEADWPQAALPVTLINLHFIAIDSGVTTINATRYTGGDGKAFKANSVSLTTASDALASFSMNPASGEAPLLVAFDGSGSTNAVSYLWDFGDGATSTLITPTHTYNAGGQYTVQLKVWDVQGCTNTASLVLNVTSPPCDAKAAFTADPMFGDAPLSVQFNGSDSTGPISAYNWDFGDGSTGVGVAPNHIYHAEGTYMATLTVTGSDGCTNAISKLIGVTQPACDAQAAFTVDHTSGNAPLTVFCDASGSTGAQSYYWDFGDGGTATGVTATHTYTSVGAFTIVLTVAGTGNCANAAVQTVNVSTGTCQDAIATFTASVNGLDATFDTTGSQGTLLFNYGDGTQGPSTTHSYSTPGTYTVTLTATGDSQCFVQDQKQVTVVSEPCDAVATFTASTQDLTATFDTTGSSGTLLFTYGDGTSGPDTTHTYAQPGTYTVTLTATSQTTGCVSPTVQKTVTVTASCDAKANFSVTTNLLTANFDTSGSNGSLMFNYGDGSTGTETSHTYATGGTYTVTLTATGTGQCQDVQQKQVTVSGAGCTALAYFSVAVNGMTATFNTNGSQGTSLIFDYGDGNTGTSTTYTYNSGGVYTVTLTATGTDGPNQCTDIHQQQVRISNPACDAEAVFSSTVNGLTATFDTTGSSGSLTFNYGDGNSGTATTHTYAAGGTYTVTLTARGSNNCTVQTQHQVTVLSAECDAAATFTASISGLNATFDTAGSQGTLTFDYGDGNTGTQASHEYSAGGTYTVKLTATGTGGCQVFDQKQITLTDADCDANAAFTAMVQGMTVMLDTTGSSGSLVFNYGDGISGTSTNHEYAAPGTYTITLTATGAGGCKTIDQKQVTVQSCSDAKAVFTVNVQGTMVEIDTTGSKGTLSFDYGDGVIGTSTTHTYDASGTYTITLTATGTSGCTSQYQKQVTVQSCSDANAVFTATTDGLTATFDTSGSSGVLSFDYGDGTTGTAKTHTYAQDGTYTVVLTAKGSGDCETQFQRQITIQACNDAKAMFTALVQGTSVVLDTTGSSGTLMFNYGDGTSGTETTHDYTQSGTYTITLTATGNSQCVSQYSQSVTIATCSDAMATFTYTVNRLAVTFDTSGSSGTLMFDYGDGTTGTDTLHAYAQDGAYTVTLTATGSGNCTSRYQKIVHVSACDAKAVFSVTTNRLTATFDISGSKGTLLFNYGDGQFGTDTTHTYANPGTYNVVLMATGLDNCTAQTSRSVTVKLEECDAKAVFSATTGELTATFNTSGSVGELWFDYGDGNFGSEKTHTYAKGGAYTVSLTATTANCTVTVKKQITVTASSQCNAVAAITATVNGWIATFDTTGSVGTLRFDYGDGHTGTEPRHVYESQGTFTVTLTATGSGNCTVQKAVVVKIENPCLAFAAFSAFPGFGPAPLDVSFNAQGALGATFSWSFSDGATASGQTVTHRFAQPGTYTATLQVTDDAGCNSSATQTLVVNEPGCDANAAFTAVPLEGDDPLVVTFNASNATGTDFAWQFGDGGIGTGLLVNHTYYDPGLYTAVLTVRGSNECTNSATRLIQVDDSLCDADAAFTVEPARGIVPLSVTCNAQGSFGQGYSWDFGDSAMATGKTVEHVFNQPGIYAIRLTMIGSDNCTNTAIQTVVAYSEDHVIPSQPDPASPGNNATDQPLTVELRITDNQDHSIQWQVASDPYFNNIVVDLINQESFLVVPDMILEPGTTYYWRTRAIDADGVESPWSPVYSFTTLDDPNTDQNHNGIPDDLEVTDPTVDLDNDGTPDIEQDDVKVIRTLDGSGYITVKGFANVKSFEIVKAIAKSNIPCFETVSFPLGLIGLKIEVIDSNSPAQVIVYFSKSSSTSARWYSYHPSMGCYDNSAHGQFTDGSRTAVLVEYRDGGYGDGDGTVNGFIVDLASGPGECYVIANFSADKLTGTAPLTVTLNAEDSNGQLAWKFGDGTKGTGHVVEHTYTHPGDYVVTLTVSGIGICEKRMTATIRVVPPTTDDGGGSGCFVETVSHSAKSGKMIIAWLALMIGFLMIWGIHRAKSNKS